MTIVRLREVSRRVDGFDVLDGVTFEADAGEFVALIGPSGSGKTSTIRAIAGFDQVTSGTIEFGDDDVTLQTPHQRDVSVVTQGSTLFPTHRVRKNLAFPLLARAFQRKEVDKRVDAESRALNIDHILERWPAHLSAGEQQLAQIARAMVRVPRVFLMDEPLANLDPPTKNRLREELVLLQRGYGVTTIYVATRPLEIRTMPDKIVALNQGRVVQVGPSEKVHSQPATPSIAELTGPIGWLEGTVATDGARQFIQGSGFEIAAWAPELKSMIGEPVRIGARPSDIDVVPAGSIAMLAADTSYDGATVLRQLISDGGTLLVQDDDLKPGDRVNATLRRFLLYGDDGRLRMTLGPDA